MIFYIILFILITYSTLKYNTNKVGIFWIVFLCFLSVFRAESVGTDTANYINIVLSIDKNLDNQIISFGDNFEIGRNLELIYKGFMLFLRENDISPRYINVFFSIVIFLFLILIFKRIKSSYSIGILIFALLFYLMSFNISRQICSSCIVLYAYTFLFEESRKKYLFFIFIIIASTFHISAFLYVIGYLVRYIKTEWFDKTILAFITLIFYLLIQLFPNFFLELITNVASYNEIYEYDVTYSKSNLDGLLFNFFYFLAYWMIFIRYSNQKLDKYDFIFYSLIIFIGIIQILDSISSRIFISIQFLQILYIMRLYKYKKMNIKDFVFIYYILINLFTTMYSLSFNNYGVVPYKIDFYFN